MAVIDFERFIDPELRIKCRNCGSHLLDVGTDTLTCQRCGHVHKQS